MNKYYLDESQGTNELKATKLSHGLKLEEIPTDPFGEYRIINKNRQLEFYDSEGKYLELPPEIKK